MPVPINWADTAGTSGGTSTQTVVLPKLTSGTDVVVVTMTRTNTATVSSIGDTVNTYTKLSSSGALGAGSLEYWIAYNVAASAVPVTITVTWSGTATYNSVFAVQVPSVATSSAIDSTAQYGTGTSIGNIFPGSIVTTQANDLVVYAWMGSSFFLFPAPGTNTIPVFSDAAFAANGMQVGIMSTPYLAGTTPTGATVSISQNASGVWIGSAIALKTTASYSFQNEPTWSAAVPKPVMNWTRIALTNVAPNPIIAIPRNGLSPQPVFTYGDIGQVYPGWVAANAGSGAMGAT